MRDRSASHAYRCLMHIWARKKVVKSAQMNNMLASWPMSNENVQVITNQGDGLHKQPQGRGAGGENEGEETNDND